MGKKKKGAWLQYIEYLIVLSLVRLIALLPYRWASDIGGLIGRAGYFIDGRHRRIAIRNLRLAFPEEGTEKIRMTAKRSFENLGRSAAEMIQVSGRSPLHLRKILHERVTIEGRDHLDQAVKRGKGVLLITAHFGNWELLGVALAAYGVPLNVVARPLDNLRIDKLLNSLRSVTGTNVIPKKGALREILKRLKQGEGVGILIDQNVSRNEGVFVDFFGYPAATNKSPALVAMRSGAALIPLFIIREGRYRHNILCGEEIPLHRSGDVERDILENTGRFTAVVESGIRKYPEQWFWMHQRWKTRPNPTLSLPRHLIRGGRVKGRG